MEYEDFKIEVSKVYLQDLKKKKELEKQQPKNTLSNSLNNQLGNLSLGSGNKSKGIPGLGKNKK
jgi:hypothetical protein